MDDLPKVNDISLLCEEVPEVKEPKVPPTIEEMQGPFFVSDDPEDAQRYCRAMQHGYAPDPFDKY